MSKKHLIALDDGHGMETAGKRTPHIPELGRAIKENEFNKAVVNHLATELKRCGFEVLLVAPTDKDDPLATRVSRANAAKADIYVSVHYDAFDSKFDSYDPEGLTVFYVNGSANGKRLAECVHSYLKGGTKQRDRGLKTADYYVLRKTNMPAILTENGFMDNKREALLMLDKAFQLEVAQEHAKGICKYFNVKYVPANEEHDSNLEAMYATRLKSPATSKLLQNFAEKRLNIELNLENELIKEEKLKAIAVELAVYYAKKDS